MATQTIKRPKTKQFTTGPWDGVINASDKPEVYKDKLYQAQNMFISGAETGGGWQMRAPFVLQKAGGTLGTSGGRYGQNIFEHVRLDGTIDRYLFVGGKLYEWDGTNTYTDITPANISISATARIYALTFADVLIVNDGVNPMWQYNPATAIATYIPFDSTVQANILAMGTPTTTLATTASFRYAAGGGIGTRGVTASIPFVAGSQITLNLWGVYRVSINSAGTFVVTPQAAVMAFASEALAHAAVPAIPAGNWDVGAITIQASGAGNWVSTVQALFGGGGATPALATNYYASTAIGLYAAFGKPVVNGGALHFILDNINGVSFRNTFVWSEPNTPLIGYRQAAFDNAWELVQTEADPLYALAATNAALYYFRRNSIGAITGVVGPNYQAGATLDSVSTSIGTTTPASVIVAHDAVWFLDDKGHPHRFEFGASPKPIWLQARDTLIQQGSGALGGPVVITGSYDANAYDANAYDANAYDGNAVAGLSPLATCAISVDHPDIEMVLMGSYPSTASTTGASVLYAFNSMTGDFRGVWDCDHARIIHTLGVMTDATGNRSLCVLGDAAAPSTPTSGTFLRQRTLAEMVPTVPWNDPTFSQTACEVVTHHLGLRDVGEWMFDLVVVRGRTTNGQNYNMGLVYHTPRGSSASLAVVMSQPPFANSNTVSAYPNGKGIVGIKGDGRYVMVELIGTLISNETSGNLPPFMPDSVTVTAIDGGADPLVI